MITFKRWFDHEKHLICDGWYLFGFVALYVRYRDLDVEKFLLSGG